MTSQQILQSDLLDILFERRNKTYGAYFLRKNYNNRLLQALGGTTLLVAAVLFFVNPSTSDASVHVPKPEYVISEVAILPEKKPEIPKPKVQQAVAATPVKQEVYLNKVKVVETQTNPVASQKDLENAVFGDKKVEAPPVTGVQPPVIPPVPSGGGTESGPVEKADPPLPSRQPQFPGGTQAWLNFLSRHLIAPQELEPGEKKTVLIRFSVDEEGVITNFQVVQSGGREFDNEVIRVLKKMPKWLPAIQNGQPIAVSFTQPVTFASMEE